MVKIVPAILEKSASEVVSKLNKLKNITDYIQLDVIDHWPRASNNLSLTKLAQIQPLVKFKKQIHLLVAKPKSYLTDCQKLPADFVYGQIEHMVDQVDFIKSAHKLNLAIGLALNLNTPLPTLDQQALFITDGVLLMSVMAGTQGKRDFDKKVIAKLRQLVRIKKEYGLNFTITLDGGINVQSASWGKANGADELCVGSYLYKANSLSRAWIKINLATEPKKTKLPICTQW